MFVLGAEADQIAIPADVEATARHHGVHAAILPGMGHMLMLERPDEVNEAIATVGAKAGDEPALPAAA